MLREQETKGRRFTQGFIRTVLAVAALAIAGTRAAEATCVQKVSGPGGGRHPVVGQLRHDADGHGGGGDATIVGLWHVNFVYDNGDPYDEAFELWHGDGTELTMDNAVSPSFGNVCLGVWRQIGPRTVRLTHVGWNWDADGKVAGTFWLWMTATVDRNGRVFAGTFKTDSYDLAGHVIPALHAEGKVRATRIAPE